MKRYTTALRQAISSENYYGALFIALTLPDICGSLTDPGPSKSRKRYSRWFDVWMKDYYTHRIGPAREVHSFLTGDDVYNLRCAYLHQGELNIEKPKVQDAIRSFIFLIPPLDSYIHCNSTNENTLQLQVDVFCRQMADAVDAWANNIPPHSKLAEQIANLPSIIDGRRTGFGLAFNLNQKIGQ